MASQPHDKSGRKCSTEGCNVVFTKSSISLTIPQREGNLIVHRTVCAKCHHKFYSTGE
jgi:hypothetical protein